MNGEKTSCRGCRPLLPFLLGMLIFACAAAGVIRVLWSSGSRGTSARPEIAQEVFSVYTGITPAAGMPLAEDQARDFVPHGTTRDGVPFYSWKDVLGRRVDVFVMRDPTTGEPRLVSFPADRVGGSEGPAESPVVTGSETSDRQPLIGPK